MEKFLAVNFYLVRFLAFLLFWMGGLYHTAGLQAQNDSIFLNKISTLPFPAKIISVDPFQNIFIVTEKNEMLKLNADGQEQFRFSNNRLGEISVLDVSNPFNILAFFPEYNLVQTFDRTLGPTGEFRLFDAGITETGAVCISSDNNIWLFDAPNFSLKKLDKNGNLILESGNLNLILGRPVQVSFLAERENLLYLWGAECGLLIFDIYGKFKTSIATPESSQVPFLFQNYCCFEQTGGVFCQEVRVPFSTFFISLPGQPFSSGGIFMQGDRLFLSTTTGLEIYEMVKK